ncbi:MAG: PilT/PilU family type 4a pilus ATPase [Planctomycetota bacterium]
MADLGTYFDRARELDASELHLSAGSIPFARVHGEIHRFDEAALSEEDADALRREALERSSESVTDDDGQALDRDFTIDSADHGRFRVNSHRHRRGWGMDVKCVPRGIPDLDDLELPHSLHALTQYRVGMVLVTGPTDSGKSSTLAALLDGINRTRKQHVITIEDPIEYVFMSQRCNVTQRQIGPHTNSFQGALRAALRQDPDVILVSEMRDLETIRTAIIAAETGHLVLGTLHTRDATTTVNRILDVFPPAEVEQVRTMLAASLRSVVSQELLPRVGGGRRAPLFEVLHVTPAVAKLIRDGRTHQIPSMIQIGRKAGMIDRDTRLAEMVDEGLITEDTARTYANNPKRVLA